MRWVLLLVALAFGLVVAWTSLGEFQDFSLDLFPAALFALSGVLVVVLSWGIMSVLGEMEASRQARERENAERINLRLRLEEAQKEVKAERGRSKQKLRQAERRAEKESHLVAEFRNLWRESENNLRQMEAEVSNLKWRLDSTEEK